MSHVVDPSWRALNGVALCQRALGQDVDAFLTYRKLLDDFGAILSAEQRAVAEARKKELGARIARLEISITQPGVRVTVDGREVGRGPLRTSTLVMPGTHQVLATRSGYRPFADRVTLAAGDARRIAVTLGPERTRVVVRLAATPPSRPMPGWIPWTTLGGGAVLVGVGGLVGWSAASDADEFDAQVAAMAGNPPRSVAIDDSLADRADSKRTAAAVFALVGSVAIATGVILIIVNRERPGRPAARVTHTPGGVALAVEF